MDNKRNMVYIKDFEFNPFQEKTYILYDETGDCVLVDPGCSNKEEEALLASFIVEKNLKPVRNLLTHGHVDHVCGSGFLLKISHSFFVVVSQVGTDPFPCIAAVT